MIEVYRHGAGGRVVEVMTADAVKCYSARDYQPEDPGVEIDRQIRRLMSSTDLTYREAMHRVLADPDNAGLAQRYAGRS